MMSVWAEGEVTVPIYDGTDSPYRKSSPNSATGCSWTFGTGLSASDSRNGDVYYVNTNGSTNSTNGRYISVVIPTAYTATFTIRAAANGNSSRYAFIASSITGTTSNALAGSLLTSTSQSDIKEVTSTSLEAGTYYLCFNQSVNLYYFSATLTPTGETTYSVTYNLGEGTGTAPTQANVAEGGSFTVAGATGVVAPSGKGFKCWNDGSNDYYAGDSYTVGNQDVVLTAQYSTVYNITFETAHSTAPDPISNASVTLPLLSFNWYGHTGWIANQDVVVDAETVTAGNNIECGKTAYVSADTKFTAVWTRTGLPLVAGVNLPDLPSGVFNVATQDIFPSENNYIVINPQSDARNHSYTWWTEHGGSMTGQKWAAPAGSVFKGSAEASSVAALQMQTRNYALRFTGATELQALMNSRKNEKNVHALLVEYSDENNPSIVADKTVGNCAATNDVYNFTEAHIATFSNLNPSTTYCVFFFGYDNSTNGGVFEVAFTSAVSTQLNVSGYGTFSCEYDVQISGAKAYKAVINNEGDKLVCAEIENGLVPAGEGVLLFGEAGAAVTASYVASAPAVEGNSLKATTKADGSIAAIESCLVLDGNTFVKYTGASFVAGKAYLPYVFGGNARPFVISFEDENNVTGITAVSKEAVAEVTTFNLMGQRVAADAKGLLVKDGVKVYIK